MSFVICKLPKAGLGNQLFPLMKAYLFADLNQLEVMVTGYHQLKIGPYLRGDKSKRDYRGYFVFEKGIIREQLDKLSLLKYRQYRIVDETFLSWQAEEDNNILYVFRRIPHWSDYFKDLKDYREEVIRLFWNIVTPSIRDEVEKHEAPCIGVHVRMGDFRKLKEQDNFSQLGVVRTPLDYFIKVINGIRSIHGSSLPVSVFTDGYRDELKPLLNISNLTIVEGNSDIVDLILLSKSKVIVTSTGSTFSYWAGFLSDATIVMHPDHIHQPIRPSKLQQSMYEGVFDPGNTVLALNIKNIAACTFEIR